MSGTQFLQHLVSLGYITETTANTIDNPNMNYLINDIYNTGVLTEQQLVNGLNTWGKLPFELTEASTLEPQIDIDVTVNHQKFTEALITPVIVKPLNPMNSTLGGLLVVLVGINTTSLASESYIRQYLKDEYKSMAWNIEIRYVIETVAITHHNRYLKRFVDKNVMQQSNMHIRQKVQKIFNDAVQSKTMDIVFLVINNKVTILRKFMSEFHPYTDVEISPEEITTLRNIIISNLGKVNAKDSESSPNIGFKIENIANDGNHEGRVDYMRIKYGYEFHIRVVNLRNNDMTYDDYFLTQETKESLQHALTNSKGLILITGARGHGKQVFTYASINEYKKMFPHSLIETLEDPVEARLIGNIAQIEIDEANGYDFIYYLKGLKRHSTNLYFIGELRDSKTTEAAINEAVSGALAITTTHAPDCAGVPKKLDVELRDAPDLLIKVLNEIKLMVNLTMTKHICPRCAIEIKDRSVLTERERRFLDSWNYGGKVYKSNPKGCDFCISHNMEKTSQMKSDGNLIKPLVIVETLEVTGEVLDLLVENNDVNSKERKIRKHMIERGKYKTQEGLKLMHEKLVSLDELLKYFNENIYH